MLLSRNPQQQQLCYLLDETLGLWWQEQMPGLCPGLAPSISLAAAGRSAGMLNVNTVKSHNLIWLFALCHHHCATICHPSSPGLVTLDISSVNVINAINTVINIIIPPAALTSVAVGLVQVWLRYLYFHLLLLVTVMITPNQIILKIYYEYTLIVLSCRQGPNVQISN